MSNFPPSYVVLMQLSSFPRSVTPIWARYLLFNRPPRCLNEHVPCSLSLFPATLTALPLSLFLPMSTSFPTLCSVHSPLSTLHCLRPSRSSYPILSPRLLCLTTSLVILAFVPSFSGILVCDKGYHFGILPCIYCPPWPPPQWIWENMRHFGRKWFPPGTQSGRQVRETRGRQV